MSKTILIIVVVLLLVVIGGGVLYSMNEGNLFGTATTTPQVVENTDNTNTNTTIPPKSASPTAVLISSVSPSDTTAVVNGTVNPKGAFTSYWYEYGTTVSLGNKTANQIVGSGFVVIQAPGYITNLVKNTTYYFRLVAENQHGKVASGQLTFKTTEGNPPPVGSAPTTKTIAADNISRTTANIKGEIIPNQNATQYWFEYGKSAELGNVSAFTNAGNGNVKIPVSISLSDLEPQTTYYFRINAQNQFGTINGSILNFKTLGPTSVTTPKVVSKDATAITASAATLNGTVNPSGAETKYWFEYSTDSLLGSVLLKTTSKVTLASGENTSSVKADVTGLSGKTTYYFRLVAENSKGAVRSDNVLTFKTK